VVDVKRNKGKIKDKNKKREKQRNKKNPELKFCIAYEQLKSERAMSRAR
jgi:hypothetical protein